MGRRLAVVGILRFASFAVLVCCVTRGNAATTFVGVDDPRGVFANSAQAESDFKAALSEWGTDNIDSIDVFQSDPTLSFGSTGVTGVAGHTFVLSNVEIGVDRAVSPPRLLVETESPGVDVPEVFTFTEPVNAFGAYFIDAATTSLGQTVTFLLESVQGGTSQSVPFILGQASTGNVAFLGVVDAVQPFDRVSIFKATLGDDYELDNVTVGFTAVPEPSTTALAALVLASFLRRRRDHELIG